MNNVLDLILYYLHVQAAVVYNVFKTMFLTESFIYYFKSAMYAERCLSQNVPEAYEHAEVAHTALS